MAAENLVVELQTLSVKALTGKGGLDGLLYKAGLTEQSKRDEIIFALQKYALLAASAGINQQRTKARANQIVPLNDLPAELTDVCLSHDWGVDDWGRDNHERVSRVNEFLKNKGLSTWFDSDRMVGDVRRKMTEGIANTKMLVFITDHYRNKVNGVDDRDNCMYEFKYGFEQKGNDMIPIVMEGRMRNPKEWRGELGAALGTKLYVDLASDEDYVFENQCEDLYQKVTSMLKQIEERKKEKKN